MTNLAAAPTTNMLLQLSNISVEYPRKNRFSQPFRAISEINLVIGEGETLGLVGESGSGKTTLGRAVLGLVPIADGTLVFNGTDITRASRRQRRNLSKDLQVVFQDPYTSLNPSLSIEQILAEPLIAQGMGKAKSRQRVREVLDQVGMPNDASERRAREFSGGQRQRIAIARALVMSPKLIVCDEPVSALDLTTQARVLDLLLQIQRDTGVAYLFISHDLDVVAHLSQRVAVMLKGNIVEEGPSAEVTQNPRHPYSQKLLLASPVTDPDRQKRRREHYFALAASANSGSSQALIDPA